MVKWVQPNEWKEWKQNHWIFFSLFFRRIFGVRWPRKQIYTRHSQEASVHGFATNGKSNMEGEAGMQLALKKRLRFRILKQILRENLSLLRHTRLCIGLGFWWAVFFVDMRDYRTIGARAMVWLYPLEILVSLWHVIVSMSYRDCFTSATTKIAEPIPTRCGNFAQ